MTVIFNYVKAALESVVQILQTQELMLRDTSTLKYEDINQITAKLRDVYTLENKFIQNTL